MSDETKKEGMLVPTNIPFFYTNGIIVSLTPSDVTLTITINGQPGHILNMARETAKTLIINLNTAITDFETKTGSKVLDMKEITEKMKPKQV